MSYFNYIPNRGRDTVIKMMKAGDAASLIQQRGYQDFSTVTQLFDEDPLNTHLGIVQEFGKQKHQATVPFYQDILQAGATLETNGWEGKFTYDLPIETDNRIKTVADMSHQSYAGIDNTEFDIAINVELAPGTKITCNGIDDDGLELVVVDSEPSNDLAVGGFVMRVKLATDNPSLTYPVDLLKDDIEYFEVDHGVAEYGEKLALVHMPGRSNMQTLEFQLGSPKGVETFWTGKADSINLAAGKTDSRDYLDEVEAFAKEGKEVAIIAQKTAGKIGTSVATMLQMLAINKFNHLMSTSLVFGQGSTLTTDKGVIRYNEGLWRQFRRGFIVTYPKRMGMQRMHLMQAADYAFKENPALDIIDRVLRFKVGTELEKNFTELYREEAANQLNNISNLLGSTSVLPTNPVKGNDLYNLSLELVRFKTLTLPSIGKVETIVDPSLNYVGMQDRRFKGANPNGMSSTTYSGVIWDVTNQTYSNNRRDLPNGVTNIGGNDKANIYLVMPQGDKIYWGTENGRYSHKSARDIVASRKTMTEGFFIYGSAAVWMRDPSRFVMIELDKAARRGFN